CCSMEYRGIFSRFRRYLGQLYEVKVCSKKPKWNVIYVLRLGGAAGTDLQQGNCPTSTTPSNTNCFSHYLAFEITSSATAYLEGLWAWLSDHDLDGGNQVNVFGGRGILSTSQGPVWMIGTAC